MKAFISTVPFGENDPTPVRLLKEAGIDFTINPIGRKLREDELASLLPGFDVLIAGTEPVTARVMQQADSLRLISRVGIGLDSVDLLAARQHNIHVSYTPDAPAPAVAELTLGFLFTLLRHAHVSNRQVHAGTWKRIFGRRITDVTVGILGAGRIGTRVINALLALGCPRILVNDLVPRQTQWEGQPVHWVAKENLYAESDVLSVHVPLTAQTRNLVSDHQLDCMKLDACLINTARGGIVNEDALSRCLNRGHLAGAALDVFEQEPYTGPLQGIERCILTAHMGSMSVDCRNRMEIEATEEAIRFFHNEPLCLSVPEDEYRNQQS